MAQTAIDPQTELGSSDKAVIEELRSAYAAMRVQLEQLFCRGHCLFIGVPGLAKTLLISTLAESVSTCRFNRIQFTPDLMPSDITGTDVSRRTRHGAARVQVHPGPSSRT
jgi:MoxR-like ATPase